MDGSVSSRRKPPKKRGHLASISCQSKGRCKKPALWRAANSVWKPVNIILKLYSEDAYISYFFKLATINRFFETALHTYDALTLPERSLRQDLSGSYDVTSANFLSRGSPRPRHLRIVPISRFNTSTVRVHATAQLLFSPRFLIKSVVKSSLRTTTISPWEAKTTAWARFAPVRGLQASVCFLQRFTLLIGRCLGAEPKLLHFSSHK